MKKPGNPMRQFMLSAGWDVVNIAKYLHDTKAGGTESGVLSERLSEVGSSVINKAVFVDKLSRPEAELTQEISKAKQQSMLRLQPIFEAIEETSQDSSDSLQSEEVEQLMASHEEELIRLRDELEASFAQVLAKNVTEVEQLKVSHKEELIRLRSELEASFAQEIEKKAEELTSSHMAELERVREEAEQERMANLSQSKQVAQNVASHQDEADLLGLPGGDNGNGNLSSKEENWTRFIERVEEKRIERSSSIPTSPVLVIGQCDLFSPLIDKLLALSRGEYTVRKIEVATSKLAKILQFRMKAIGEAANAQIGKIEEDHATVPDLSLAPLSDVLNIMKETGKDEDEEERTSPYSMAAMMAAAEAIDDLKSRGQKTTKKTWLDMCPLGQKVKVLVYRAAQLMAVCRVLQMLPFVDFLDNATKDRKLKKRVFAAIADSNLDYEELDCASVLESFIIPRLQIGASEEYKQVCFDLLVLMTNMSKNDFRSYFEESEIIPMTKVYKDCSDENFERYKASSTSGVRHLSLDTTRGQIRRRESMRGLLYSLTMPRVEQILVNCSWPKLHIEMASRGIHCAPASNFTTTTYGFLHSEGIVNPSEEFISSMLKKGGPVQDLMKRGTATLKELRDDYIFVDLTADFKNDTDECLNLLRGYFEEKASENSCEV